MKMRILVIALFPMLSKAQVIPDTTTRPAAVHSSKVNPIPSAYTNSIKLNYIRTWEATKAFTSESTMIDATRTVAEVKQSTEYFDGLGRPIQTVTKKISPLGNDLVLPLIYDAFGRQMYRYLPYVQINGNTSDGKFKTDPFNSQASFFSNGMYNPGVVGEQIYYSRTNFESSPLNRVDTTFSPGNNWGGSHVGVSLKYEVNKIADSVRIWSISMATGSSPITSSVYSTGQLYKTITVNEHGMLLVEYKDKDGQIILKKVQLASSPSTHHTGWLCTYYVYDDLGNLRFIIPPEAVEAIAGAGLWSITSTVKDELCFRYEYDITKRMIIKKVPGAGEVSMVYDAKDRLIMTQDAKLEGSQWLITQFDDLNRPVKTYLWNNTANRTTHQASAISSLSYPTFSGTYEQLTENFYDDYNWTSGMAVSNSLNTAYTASSDYINSYNSSPLYAQPVTATNMVKGMLTGTRVKVLSSGMFLDNVMLYDDRKRLIQVQGTNIQAGVDIITNQYDFSGKIIRSHMRHDYPPIYQAVNVLTKNEYDNAGRLINVKKKVNGGSDKQITNLNYNELGEVKTKELGNLPGTSDPLETLDYTYNIQGALIGINRGYANPRYVSEATTQANRWFGMQFSYDFGFTQSQKNGNIAGMRWKSTGSDSMRAFGFGYDATNRLLKADFTQYAGSGIGAWNTSAGIDFSMKMGDGNDPTTAYDGNGNILRMWQKGLKLTGSNSVDSLTYGYASFTNKLITVSDAITADNKLGDFTDRNITGDDYQYDANGNMVVDKNKNIDTIVYNHLNLPAHVETEKGDIDYLYDATGLKLRKTVTEYVPNREGDTIRFTIITYVNGFVYENSVVEIKGEDPIESPHRLQYFGHEEGRLRNRSAETAEEHEEDAELEEGQCILRFEYDFFITDHLGNVRMVLTEQERTDVYEATMEQERDEFENQLFNNRINLIEKFVCFDEEEENLRVQKIGTAGVDEPVVVGGGIVLKVMAGDVVNARTFGWWNSQVTGNNPGSLDPLEELLAGLFAGGIVKTGTKGNVSDITGTMLLPGILQFLNQQSDNYESSRSAYLNWMLLDGEQFKLVQGGYGSVALMDIHDGGGSTGGLCNIGECPEAPDPPEWCNPKILLEANEGNGISITKNGYLYIYLTNTNDQYPVYFDDLHVEHVRGPLLEETHYYPFGLTMAGISSRAAAFGEPDNKQKFNNGTEFSFGEFSDGSGLDLYETTFRSYDPQMGRFHQIDPLADFDSEISPYAFAYNNPILINDPLGLTGDSVYVAQQPLPEVIVVCDPKPNNSKVSPPGEVNVSTGGIFVGKLEFTGSGSFRIPIPLPFFPTTSSKSNSGGDYIFGNKWDQMAEDLYRSFVQGFAEAIVEVTTLIRVMPIIAPIVIAPWALLEETDSDEANGAKHGGGKNAQHSNQNARDVAKENYEAAKSRYNTLKSKPNKTPADKAAEQKAKKEMNHYKKKMDNTGENHSQKAKGRKK